MKIIYLTATGNCLYVAQQIGGTTYSLPHLVESGHTIFSDDKIGIVFPIYGLSVPPYITRFLETAQFHCDYLFAVMTYGMYDGAATTDLRTIAARTKKQFSYINTLKMVDNWLPGFDMDKQIRHVSKKQIEQHLETIIKDIKQAKRWIKKDSWFDKRMTNYFSTPKQNHPPRTASAIHAGGQTIQQFFLIEKTCTKCGICTKVCPVNNIEVTPQGPHFSSDCINCLACTHNCPQNSIRLQGERSRARFRNPHISLQEIIHSNSLK